VVTVVLADPPAGADPDKQVADDQADAVVGPPGAEHLPVAGVVRHEPELRKHDGEEHGGGQLPPRVPKHEERGPSDGQRQRLQADPDDVPSGSPLQQPRLLDAP
jgi:hypothetical protein